MAGSALLPAAFCILQPVVAAFSSPCMQHRNRFACYAETAKTRKDGCCTMKLNEKIYACRRRAGLSQEALAEKLRVEKLA